MTSSQELDFQCSSGCRSGRAGGPRRPWRRRCSCLHPRAAQFRDSQEVVGCSGNEGRHLCLGLADEACLAHAADRFQPAEDLLNPFAFSLAYPVALGTDGDVRADLLLAQMGDEILYVINLFGRERLRMNAAPARPGKDRSGGAVLGLFLTAWRGSSCTTVHGTKEQLPRRSAAQNGARIQGRMPSPRVARHPWSRRATRH